MKSVRNGSCEHVKSKQRLIPFGKRFETEGFSGLGDKAGRGLKPSLTENSWVYLFLYCIRHPHGWYGYTRGFKTKDVVIYPKELGKAFATCCRNIMKNMSCGLKVPRPRHKKETKKMLMILESLKKTACGSW